MKVLTVRDGKGGKDRTVPLPQVLVPELNAHLETVMRVHGEDSAAGYAGTFLPGALEVKYKRGEKAGLAVLVPGQDTNADPHYRGISPLLFTD